MINKFKLIGYENIQVSHFLLHCYPHFKYLKNVCVAYIFTHACVLRIYMEICVFDKDFGYCLPQYTQAL